jgi:TolA-binding protein
LARNYPKSVHLDNAYYLTGVLQFQSNRYAEAVRAFGIVADRYPQSNKRPAAMFAKARTYELLGLKPQAKRLWNLIVKEYPGSQESQRAWMQLKVATMDSQKTKR